MAAPLYFLGIILLASRSYIIKAQLSVTSRHDSILPSSATGAVEGSVLWLYCDVNSISSSLLVAWSKDGGSLVQDVPHIRLRTSTSSSSTTLLLVLDNMVSSDAGVYQCTAQDGLDTASGNELNITVLSSSADGILRIAIQDPLTVFTGPVSYSSQTNAFYPNRTAVNTGAMVTLSFTSGHVGDDMNSYTTPTAVWLKDGALARITPTNMAVGGNGILSSTLSFTFQASDEGVYQCVFSGSGQQVYWTIPLRLDTGSLTEPERVSPPVSFLTPPEKLVLEVRASGGYDFIAWTRVGDRSFRQNAMTELVNFHEIFVRQPTTTSEYGTYRAQYALEGGVTRILVVPTASPNTAAGTSATVIIAEGSNVNISCTSSGGPIPTVTWTLNNQPTSFSQTDVITNPTDTTTPGGVISTLHIVNAQYPTHDGVYTCIGTNTISGSARTENATITVQVPASPEVELRASLNPVAIGEVVTLTCAVTRGNPMSYSYTWRHNGSAVSPTSTRSTVSLLIYHSIHAEDVGDYSCSASNGIQPDGGDSLTIITGVPPDVSIGGQLMETPEIEVGSTLSLAINIRAFNLDLTDITWSHIGSVVMSGQDRITITSPSLSTPAPVSSTLERTSVVPLDAGEYTVSATNPAGSSNFTFQVAVTAGPAITSPSGNESREFDVGDSISLSCTARGFPAPTITWAPNPSSPPTSSSITDGDGLFITNSTLIVASAQRNDTLFSCNASNDQGSETRVFTININFAPEVVTSFMASNFITPQSLILTCSFEGSPLPAISWIRKESDVFYTTTMEGERTISIANFNKSNNINSTFTVSSSAVSDAGSYTCMATNRLGSMNSSAEISVYETPTIASPFNGTQFTTNEETDITFTCIATGLPAPLISFSYEGQAITGDPRPMTSDPTVLDRVSLGNETTSMRSSGLNEVTRTLTLSNAAGEDLGEFMCNASVDMPGIIVGSTTVSFSLLVYLAPSVSLAAGQIATTEPEAGNNVILSVNITRFNRPLTSINWSHSGNVLTDGVDRITINSSTLDSPPVISTLQRSSLIPLDFGPYLVNVTNEVGSDTFTFDVEVPGTAIITSPSADVQNVEFDEGTTALLSCTARGLPRPNITWSPGPDSSRTISTSERIDDEGFEVITSNISIANIQRDDLSYICNVSNSLGHGTRSFSLTVNFVANITEYPTPELVTSPAMATFTCVTSGLPRPNITWTDPDGNKLVSGNSNVIITAMNVGTRELRSTLQVSMTMAPVSGTYTCATDNGVTGSVDITSAPAFLTVHVVPNITSYLPAASSRYVVNVTDNIMFQCTATGVPPPDIQWYRGNVLLNSSTDRVTVRTRSVDEPERALATVTREITLSQTSTNDTSSDYRCRATNEADNGQDSEVFELLVQVPPQVALLAPNQRVVAISGGEVTLSFNITNAIPTVQISDIRWYYAANARSGSPDFTSENFQDIIDLMNRTSVSTLHFSSDRLTLRISNIVQAIGNVMETDQGRYFLSVTNPAGERSNFIDVIVRGPPQIVAGPIDEYKINNGSDAIFSCEALAIPQHNVTWSFMSSDGTVMEVINTEGTSTSKYLIVNDIMNERFGQLTVRNVVFEDRGIYACEVTNEFGTASARANLTVHVTPNILIPPSNVIVLDPNGISFTCMAEGFPRPTISWFRVQNNVVSRISNDTDFTTFESDTGTQQVTSVLTLVSVRPSLAGEVICNASNIVDYDSQSATLTVNIAPPGQLSVGFISGNTFTITWSYQSSRISFFTVTIVDNSVNKIMKTNIDAEVSNSSTWRATFEGLSPATRYNVTIIATYEDESRRLISAPSSIELYTSSSTIIQVRFEVTALCSNWINESPVQKSEDIVNELKMLLLNFCSCVSLNDNLFSNGGFRCFKKSLNHVTYRARLHGTASVSAMELAAHYDMLLASGPVLNIEAQFVNADSFCPVVIDSFDEAECAMAANNMISATVLIVTVTTCIIIVLSLILIALVVAIVAFRRKRTKKSIIRGEIASPPGMPTDGVNMIMVNNQAPQYEYIDMKLHGKDSARNLKKENDKNQFTFTQCEAYDTTTFSSNQTESDNNYSTVPLEGAYETIN